MPTVNGLGSFVAMACAGSVLMIDCASPRQDAVRGFGGGDGEGDTAGADSDPAGGDRGGDAAEGGATGNATGQGGAMDDTDDDTGGMSGADASGGRAAQNAQTGGATGDAGSGGAGGSAQLAPEYLWVNRVVEWRNGSGFANAIDETRQLPDLSDSTTRYGRGKTRVRVVVEQVSGPTALETCFSHNKHGWDYSTCINCAGEITKPGTIECHAELAFCYAKGREGAGCHGAGAATLSDGPPRHKKHVLLKWDEAVFKSTSLLNWPGAATPFKAKYQIVFVPAGQEFSGWAKYPLP